VTTDRTRRRAAAPLLLAALLVGLVPATVRAASPVAVDDPNPICQNPSFFGGAFPIPEDWNGGSTGFERYFLFAGGINCGLLQNDTDADLDTLAIDSVTNGPHGTVIIVDPVSVAYRPDKDYSTPEGDWVSDTFTYRATDGETTSNSATMSIWLAPINDPPTFTEGPDVTVAADSGAYSAAWASAISPGPANEGSQTVTFQVTNINDGGTGLFAADPAIAADGTLSFTPAAGKIGLAHVTVEAHDDGGLVDYDLPPGDMDPPDDTSDPVTFDIAVVPDAVDDTTTTNEDEATSVDVLANDDTGGSAVVESASDPAKGTATVAEDGSGVFYSPDPDANGSDSFTYTISGGDTATVHVTITPVEDDPVADDETLTILEDATATSVDVLAGDTDPDGDTLHVSAATDGAKGSVVIAGDELSLTYDPNPNVNGSDTFTYDADDGNGNTDTASVHVTITSVNDVPSFSHGSVDLHEDEDTAGDVSGWASSISTGPSNESGQTPTFLVTGNTNPGLFSTAPSVDATTGDLTWTPTANASGTATVQVAIKDDGGTANGGDDTSTAVAVTITVDAVNDVPSATTDSASVTEDVAKSLTPQSNDTDADGDPLTLTAKTNGTKGTVSIAADHLSLLYTPTANLNGADSFTYTVSDGHGGTKVGTVNVTITAVNDRPTFTATLTDVTANEDTAGSVAGWATAISAGPADESAQTKTFETVSDSNPGLFAVLPAVDGTGKLTWTPKPNASGTATLQIRLRDSGGVANGGLNVSSPAKTVTIHVTAVNDNPVAVADSTTVTEDQTTAKTLTVLGNDTDVEADALTITGTTAAAKGTVTIATDKKSVTYKPLTNKSGTDTFTYTISDGHGGSATGTVTVTITPVNDVPNAVNDLATVKEGDGAIAVPVLSNDQDIDGDTLKITAKTNGAKGTVTITGGGTGLTYDPAALKEGSDTFTYTVSDGHGGTDTATVLVTITPDSAAPVITNLLETLVAQTLPTNTTNTVNIGLSWTGSDPGSGIKSYQLQVSINGGTYTNLALSSATATSSSRAPTFARQYRYRIRATDGSGNVSAYVSWPAFTPTRYQEDSTSVAYTGAWTSASSTSKSSGKSRYATATSARATFTASGRDIGWVATTGTTGGRADVYVDGVKVATVSLKKTATAYRQLVWSRHFASAGAHTVELRPLGDGRVDLDALVVLK
jgi:hypothetical protein